MEFRSTLYCWRGQGGIQWLKLYGDPDAGLSHCHGIADDEVSRVRFVSPLDPPPTVFAVFTVLLTFGVAR